MNKLGNSVFLIDLTNCELHSSQDKFGKFRKSLLDDFYKYLFERNLNVITLGPNLKKSVKQLGLSFAINNRGLTVDRLIDTMHISKAERISIKSFLATHTLRSLIGDKPIGSYLQNVVKELFDEMTYVKSSFRTIANQIGVDTLVIQNGRWRSQICLTELCKEFDISTLYVNTGRIIGESYLLNDFFVQDVLKFQQWGESNYQPPQSTNLEQEIYIKSWLDSQKKNEGGFNSTTKPSTVQSNSLIFNSQKVALVASSSSSEFDFFRKVDHEWSSQFDALETACRVLKQNKYYVVLRLHPNTYNYNWSDFHSVFRACKKFADEIYFPWDTESTSQLIDMSSLVVVWDSTVGLEASALGKTVIALSETYYSKLINLAMANSPSALESLIVFGTPSIDRKALFKALYFLNNFGQPFPIESQNEIKQLMNIIKPYDELRRRKVRRRLFVYSEILYKSSFFTKYYLLTPREIFSILEKLFGKRRAKKILLRLANWDG